MLMQIQRKKLIFTLNILLLLVIFAPLMNIQASSAVYRVFRIQDDGSFSALLHKTTDFNDAVAKMRENAQQAPNVVVVSSTNKSPLGIVATDRGYAQAYPFRWGVQGNADGKQPNQLIYVYHNPELTNDYTYFGQHYKMFYHESVMLGNGNIVAKITMQGATGYVDINKIDIIPTIFMEKGFNMTLGGNESYYKDPEQVYHMRVLPDYYQVIYDVANASNKIVYHYQKAWYTSPQLSLNYGIAPSWLPVGRYYSADGIHFYYDVGLTNPVKNGGNIGAYYNYYQWLPFRSYASISGEAYNNMLKNKGYSHSVMQGFVNGKYLSQQFVDVGNQYRMNSLLIFAQAGLESAFGTSQLAKDRYNLFGWNAFDSNPNAATPYENVGAAVHKQMSSNMMYYINYERFTYQGHSFGNKGSGVTVKYASDPLYGMKIADIAYDLDLRAGFSEYNKYQLGKFNDNSAINVRSAASTNAGVIFTTKSGRINQTVIILEKVNDFYKIQIPLNNDYSAVEGYVHEGLLTPIEKVNRGTVNSDQTRDSGVKQQFIIEAGVRLRQSWTTGSAILLDAVPAGTVFEGEYATNGWVKITYNGLTGYVSGDYASVYHSATPSVPSDDNNGGGSTDPGNPNPPQQVKGDINGDGRVSIADLSLIQSHLLGIKKLEGDRLERADINKDGRISIADLSLIQSHLLGIKRLD